VVDQEEGGNSSGILMVPVRGDENGEGEAIVCDHCRRGRGGGGEAAPRCRGWTTQRRVARRLKSDDRR
jgi:hypothetical protein